MNNVPRQLSTLMRCTTLKLGVTVANNKVHNFNSGTLCCRWNWKASLSLIRLFREDNFDLYCQSLVRIIPYFFVNNNMNYARWLPIDLRVMLTLGEKHAQLAHAFLRGAFVVGAYTKQDVTFQQ